MKHHRDSDYGNCPDDSNYSRSSRASGGSECYHFSNRPLPATPGDELIINNSHYEVLEIRNREVITSAEIRFGKKSPPIPPPKPSRASKNQSP